MTTEVKKNIYVHQEFTHSPAGSSNEYPLEFTPREHRKIVHRIDRRLVTMVGVCWFTECSCFEIDTDKGTAYVLCESDGQNESFCSCRSRVFLFLHGPNYGLS